MAKKGQEPYGLEKVKEGLQEALGSLQPSIQAGIQEYLQNEFLPKVVQPIIDKAVGGLKVETTKNLDERVKKLKETIAKNLGKAVKQELEEAVSQAVPQAVSEAKEYTDNRIPEIAEALSELDKQYFDSELKKLEEKVKKLAEETTTGEEVKVLRDVIEDKTASYDNSAQKITELGAEVKALREELGMAVVVEVESYLNSDEGKKLLAREVLKYYQSPLGKKTLARAVSGVSEPTKKPTPLKVTKSKPQEPVITEPAPEIQVVEEISTEELLSEKKSKEEKPKPKEEKPKPKEEKPKPKEEKPKPKHKTKTKKVAETTNGDLKPGIEEPKEPASLADLLNLDENKD